MRIIQYHKNIAVAPRQTQNPLNANPETRRKSKGKEWPNHRGVDLIRARRSSAGNCRRQTRDGSWAACHPVTSSGRLFSPYPLPTKSVPTPQICGVGIAMVWISTCHFFITTHNTEPSHSRRPASMMDCLAERLFWRHKPFGPTPTPPYPDWTASGQGGTLCFF